MVLLSLLKLDCLYHGNIAELKDGPDILAASDQGHLYVIECTTGDINSRGKLRRLYERTNVIRAQLANSAYRPLEILAVMVTTSTKAETLHCLDELEAYKIALVSREDIARLLTQIEAPPTADRLFAAAVGTIPTAKIEAPGSGIRAAFARCYASMAPLTGAEAVTFGSDASLRSGVLGPGLPDILEVTAHPSELSNARSSILDGRGHGKQFSELLEDEG